MSLGHHQPWRAFQHLASQFPPLTVESESLELAPGTFQSLTHSLARNPVLCLALPPMCCVTPSESLDISGEPFFHR